MSCDVRVVVVVRLEVVMALGRLLLLVEGRKTWLGLRTWILLRTSRGMVEVVAVARWSSSLREVMVVREAMVVVDVYTCVCVGTFATVAVSVAPCVSHAAGTV